MSTALSELPKVATAHSFTGRGAASTARLATESNGEVTPSTAAATASAAAMPAAPANNPAVAPASSRLARGRRSGCA